MMKDSTSVVRRRARAWPSPLPTATAAIVTVVTVLLAGCNGGPSSAGSAASSTGASAGSPSATAYSACMRSQGVPSYPDPDSSGQLPKGDAHQFGVSTEQYQSAQQACQHLLSTGGSLHQQEHQCMENSDCPAALVQQMMTADHEFARCMRSHGVSNFPDPTNGGSSGPIFNITDVGISDAASHASQFEAKLTECGRLAGGNAPESFE